jgi:purine-nucleoside phosphorylase
LNSYDSWKENKSMKEFITLDEIDQVVASVRKHTSQQPRVGFVLGSGLGGLADMVENADKIPYHSLPFWPASTVQGHVGQLVVGDLMGVKAIVQQGRAHFYEGYSMAEVTLPIRVMQRMGVEILIVTNAAGAINPDYQPGDVMLIVDHIALVGMTGFNPLRGPNLDEFGPRFPDMSQAYDRNLMSMARQAAAEHDVLLHEGVYIGLSGPSFETPADLRFLRTIGADAVGMSTVPEVTVAHHGGTRVLGFSGISNKANLDGSTQTTHEEVLQAGRTIVPKMQAIIEGVLNRIKNS